MKDKRVDEILAELTDLKKDMRTIKEVHVVLAQQVEGLKQVCSQLHTGLMKQAEMMGRFTKQASDNSEMMEVVAEEMKVIQADQNTYRNRMNEISVRMGSVEKSVKNSFKRLAQAFSQVDLPEG